MHPEQDTKHCCAVHLAPARERDAGYCIARLPRNLRVPAGAPILLRQQFKAILCVSLPLAGGTISRKELKCSGSSPLENHVVPHVRADVSLAFCWGWEAESSNVASVARLVTTPSAGAGSMAVATRVDVNPVRPGMNSDALLSRTRTALCGVRLIPDFEAILPCDSQSGSSSPALMLFDHDGITHLARILVTPRGPAWVDASTEFYVKQMRMEDCGASLLEIGEHKSATCTTRNQRQALPAYTATCGFLRQDISSFAIVGAKPMRGLLLSGPPGVGKTSGVLAAARDCGYEVQSVRLGKDRSYGAPARALRKAFSDAKSRLSVGTPALVFIDEVDCICPKRTAAEGGSSSAEDARSVAQLLTLMDGGGNMEASATAPLYVIAATNRRGDLDPALRRPGRFDKEVILGAPNAIERAAVLCNLDRRLDGSDATEIASVTPGFVAGDLAQLAVEVEKLRARRFDAVPAYVPSVVELYMRALRVVRPSLLRGSISSEVPATRWSDIGGLECLKRRLRMSVEFPLQYPETFACLGLQGPRGILLHGPPGCSKTTLGRALAMSGCANFLHMSGADVYSCYVGEAERILREAFNTARAASPSILFLDELDGIVGKRDSSTSQESENDVQSRVLSTLLTEMDGLAVSKGVLVVGATNRIDMLDDALLRPGRFDEIIRVDPPDDSDRLDTLRVLTARLPLSPKVNLEDVSRLAANATGAQLKALCDEAALSALRESMSTSECVVEISSEHLRRAADTLFQAGADHLSLLKVDVG